MHDDQRRAILSRLDRIRRPEISRLLLAEMSESQGEDEVALPDQTTDDTDRGWGEQGEDADDADDDERLLREKPPHW
jgi:hypothetical protein